MNALLAGVESDQDQEEELVERPHDAAASPGLGVTSSRPGPPPARRGHELVGEARASCGEDEGRTGAVYPAAA